MRDPISKITKRTALSLLPLTIMLAGNTNVAAETVDERIQKLEQMVLELKQEAADLRQQAEEEKVARMEKEETMVEEEASSTKHTYAFGGFAKATGSWSDYGDGDLASGSAGRDFYIPGTIPVGGASESTDFDFHGKESRINFKSTHELGGGNKVTTFFEMDFLLPPGGNERVSNSYNPRLRHAFLTYNNWLFGQTWSTFQDVAALAESVDFLATPEGIVFERQAMVRYTHGPWQFALENPETTLTPFSGGARIVTDDNAVPDVVARYNHKASWGHITVSGLLRQLAYEAGPIDDDTIAGGVSLSGKFKVGPKDDIRVNFAYGSGMGRYVGLNTANGGVIDASGNIDAIDSILGSVAYRHFWNAQWRSNFMISAFEADNDTALTGTGVTKSAMSAQVNLLYSPVEKLTLGGGFLYAEREIESGADGDLKRLIFSAKYAF